MNSRKVGRVSTGHLFAVSLLFALADGMAACDDEIVGPGASDAANGTDSPADISAPGQDALPDSSAPEASPDIRSEPDGGPPDGNGGIGDGPTCSAHGVWPQNAAGFTYAESGGYYPGVPDAICSRIFRTYEFSMADKTLSFRNCFYSIFSDASGATDITAHLTDGAVMQVVACIQALSTCVGVDAGSQCTADLPGNSLTVRANSGSSTTYKSDRSGTCGSPPDLSYPSLLSFENCIYQIIAAACSADGGADAGNCSPAQPDGGAPDSGGGD